MEYKNKLTFIMCFLQVLLESQIHKKIRKSWGQSPWPHMQASLKMELSPREHSSSFSVCLGISSWEGCGHCSLTPRPCLYLCCFRVSSPWDLFSSHVLGAFMVSLLPPGFCLLLLCVHLCSAFCIVSWPLSNPSKPRI